MAVKKPAKAKTESRFGWRGLVITLLSVVGIVSLLGYMMVHWTERQLLTTDNWVELVSPLPKDPQVSSALGTYTVDKLFDATDLQSKITEALPDRAAFLAPTLTERLDARLTTATTNLVASDKFQTIWTEANRATHQRLMDQARGTTPPPKVNLDFDLDLSAVREKINDKLGTEIQPLLANPNPGQAAADKRVEVDAKIDVRLDRFRKFVKTVDVLNDVLWLLAAAAILGALVISRRRRRLLMILSLSALVVALLQLIGVNAFRPSALNHIQNEAYRPAVGVVYDSLTKMFRQSSTAVAVVSAIIFAVCYGTQKRFLDNSGFITKQMAELKKSSVYDFVCKTRIELRRYFWKIAGVVVILSLALGAFALSLDWVGVIRLGLVTLIILEFVGLVATRSGARLGRAAN